MKYKVTIKLSSDKSEYEIMMAMVKEIEHLIYIEIEDEHGETTGFGEAGEDTDL